MSIAFSMGRLRKSLYQPANQSLSFMSHRVRNPLTFTQMPAYTGG